MFMTWGHLFGEGVPNCDASYRRERDANPENIPNRSQLHPSGRFGFRKDNGLIV
jgi:hypothetical protein